MSKKKKKHKKGQKIFTAWNFTISYIDFDLLLDVFLTAKNACGKRHFR